MSFLPRLFFLLLCFVVLGNRAMAAAYTPPVTNRTTFNFNGDWSYLKGDATGAQAVGFNDATWTPVGLPHTTKLVSDGDTLAYLGVSWYRKHFTVSSDYQGRKVYIEFGAAMQVADVWVNGTLAVHHEGGYAPFTADVTSLVVYGGGDNIIAVKLDSSPNANWAPGWGGIDFQYHGGLYRDVTLTVCDPLHVTDAVYANQVAGGGVFVTYPAATTASATVEAKTHVFNETAATKSVTVLSTLVDAGGNIVQSASTAVPLAAGAATSVTQDLIVASPNLWHPYTPYLYTLHTVIQDGATAVDYVKTRVGIRRIQWSHAGGFVINGARFKARGGDYHQDVYLLGNAMPKTAIYNDVKRIKDAGLDFIRGSHYPHDPAFYDACDELGVLVMDSITGWQQFNDTTAFKNNTYQECRDMIRRDRNHPCVVVWETSLNESGYSTAWAQTIQVIAHAEYPGDQAYTAGWTTSVFDIYCASSQSGVRNSGDARPIIIDEYGSWEYGQNNSTSDVKREDTEAKLLQQCTNITESLNANLGLSWFSADGYWVFGDYTGYLNNLLNHCGVVDHSRIPKFSYYFFKSQRDPGITIPNVDAGPMVYIANYWQPGSPTTVRVFSNCSQVALYLNNVLVATQSPDTNYPNLPHPPFTFNVGSYTAGTLRAEGRIGGVTVATYSRATAGAPAQIVLRPEGSTSLDADGGDSRLVFIDVVDASGQVVPAATNAITLSVTGAGAKIIGPAVVAVRAGQTATWVQAGRSLGAITLTASASGLASATANLTSVAVPGLAALSPPAAPSGLTGATANGQVNLSWTDNSLDEASFLVEHSTDNVTFTTAATVAANTTVTSFSEASSATYYYRVSAQNAAGLSAPSNPLPLNVVAAVTASAWTYADIGGVGATGSSSVSSATGGAVLTINASGADIWNAADAFGFYYLQRTGDFEIVARVNTIANINTFAKAGVMIRDTLDPASAHAYVALTPASGAQFIRRTVAGAASSVDSVGGLSIPRWVRLVRSGNSFTSFYSSDGTVWTSFGSVATIAMGSTVYVGIAVTSHASGTLCAATLDKIAFVQGGWTDADIGAVNILGTGFTSGNSAATAASGGDIWGVADAFHYIYQPRTGNFAVSAQVTNVSNTNSVAKAGVMIRDTLDPASAHALVNLTPGGTAEFIQRTTAAGASGSGSAANQPAPRWVRLVRVGNTFSGYVSPDGLSWSSVGSSASIPMNAQVYLGLAATSHNNSALSFAAYQNVSVELPGTLGFTLAADSVSETAGSATVSVSRLNGSIGPVSVTYATAAGGTAAAGTNYTSVSGTLNWADGDIAPKTFTVPILNDNVSGPDKTVALSLSAPGGGAVLGTSAELLTLVENPTQNWRFAKFGANANNSALSGDAADPDGDGVANLLEYAIGTDPNSASSVPALAISLPASGWDLDFHRNATANDVTVYVERSFDLAVWNTAMSHTAAGGWVAVAPNATAVESAVSGVGVDQWVQVNVHIPDLSAGATTKVFFRLKASRP